MHTGSTTLQDLFDLYKKKVFEQIDSVSIFDDASEYEEAFKEIQMKVKAMSSLIHIRQDLDIDTSSYTPTPHIETPVILDDIKEEEFLPEEIYVFQRKLRGGLVILEDMDYFIPEQMVRDMNVTHGDEVEITRRYMHKGLKRYNFKIVNRVGQDLTTRIQLNRYVVTCSPENDSLILHSDLEGNHDNPGHIYYISHNDIENYSLKEGSVVDAAYYQDNPEGISIIFKHTKTVDASAHVQKYDKGPSIRLPLNVFYLHSPSLEHSEQDEVVLSFISEHFEGNHTMSYGVEMQETISTNIRNADFILISGTQFNSKMSSYILDKAVDKKGVSTPTCILPTNTAEILKKLHQYKKELSERLETLS